MGMVMIVGVVLVLVVFLMVIIVGVVLVLVVFLMVKVLPASVWKNPKSQRFYFFLNFEISLFTY